MEKPSKDEISRLHQYFAIQCNNDFWPLSEGELDPEDKQKLLTLAYASLFHWSDHGTDDNIHLAVLAVARAHCLSESSLSLEYAEKAFNFFDEGGADWVQAFTNAVLSHALHLAGEKQRAAKYYENAQTLQSKLSDGDRKIFDLTFCRVPDPR